MLKKRWLVSLFLLWILAVGQLAQGHEQEEEKVAGVFARIGEQEQTGAVEYYGVYKKEFLESEDQEKFLRRAGLLRCVQALSHHFPDLFIILIVVAQVVKELSAKIVPNTDIASCSGAPSSVVSPIRRSRWTAVSSKGLWGRW